MAGSSRIDKAPYPNGTYTIRLGGFVPFGLTTTIVDKFMAPWDCWIKSVHYYYVQVGSNDHLDAVVLSTVDGSKTVVTSANMSGNLDMVKQTLHADMATTTGPYQIVAGDEITLSADSSAGTEQGIMIAQIELVPTSSSPTVTER